MGKKMVNRGRLVENRNKCLLTRYYFLSEIKRLRFDDVLKQLSENEFFLTEKYITNIIREGGNYLQELRDNKKTQIEFKKDYPGFRWS